MEFALTNDQLIYLSLLKLIPQPDICRYIINKKNNIEKEEALTYHKDIWNMSASIFFKAIQSQYPIITYKIDHKEYIMNTDIYYDYYIYTGYSYQVRDLLLDLIKIPNKKLRYLDDKLNSTLAENINHQVKLSFDNIIQSLELD